MKKITGIFTALAITAIIMPQNIRAEEGDELPALTGLEEYEKKPEPQPTPNAASGSLPSIAEASKAEVVEAAPMPAAPTPAVPPAIAQEGKPAEMPSITDAPSQPEVQMPNTTPETEKAPPAPVFDKSLMFTSEEIEQVKAVYDAYRQRMGMQATQVSDTGSKVDELIRDLTISEPTKLPDGIYLNSILYRSPENATAWINGQKFKVGDIINDIHLVSLSANSAKVEWKSAGYNINFSEWQEKFPHVGTSDEQNGESKLPASQRGIEVDSQKNSIFITLRPNQHLDFQRKSVREGKPVPTVEEQKATTLVENIIPTGLPEAIKDAPDKLASLLDKDVPIDKVATTDEQGTATFKIGADGHFQVPANLDGTNITFKVDTGATVTIISSDDATKIGIDVDSLDYNQEGKIADGSVMKAAVVTIKNFKVKDLNFENVTVFVAKGSFAEPLLGMSFFQKLKKFSFENDTLTITK